MSQEQLARVQQLLTDQRYEEALVLLQSMDHPMAPQLIQQVEQAMALQQTAAEPAESASPAEASPPPEASPQAWNQPPPAAEPTETASPPEAPVRREPPQVLSDGRRVHQEGVYEMLWDCQYCDAKKLLGKTHRFCPNCGAAQNPASRYFPAEDEMIAVSDHVFVGEDQICPNCDTLNSGNAEFCGNCGAPLTEAARAKKLATETRREGERFESSGSRDIVKERFDAEMERIGVRTSPKKQGRDNPLIKYGLIGLVAVILIGIGVALFWTEPSSVYVTGHSWEREVRVEQYGPQAESRWCSDGLPAGAYNVSRRSEVHHYNQVPDGEECDTRRIDQGDGTFRQERVCRTVYRDEPVYADRCYYTIDRWTYSRSVYARGDSRDDPPTWPQPSLACEGQFARGCERTAGQNETYTLHLRASDNDADYSCDVAHTLWDGADIESRWQMEVRVVGGSPRCDTLERVQ